MQSLENAHEDVPQELTPSENLQQHLCSIIRSYIRAVNIRNLDPASYPWTHLAQNSSLTKFCTDHPINLRGKSATLDFWAQTFSQDRHRDFQVRILDLDAEIAPVTKKKKKGEFERARVFMNAEAMGMPGVREGLWRQIMAVFEFRVWQGMWMIVREETIMGKGSRMCALDECENFDG